MTSEYLIYLVIGRLLIYLLQKFLSEGLENKFLKKLFNCDLCLGVWVYSAIAILFKINILSLPYIPIVTGIVVGCASSFVVHVFILGWRTKYEVVVIE